MQDPHSSVKINACKKAIMNDKRIVAHIHVQCVLSLMDCISLPDLIFVVEIRITLFVNFRIFQN